MVIMHSEEREEISSSLDNLREKFSQAKVRSTTQRFGII